MPHTDEIEYGSLLPTPNSSPREVTEEQTMKRKEMYGGETRAMYLEHYAVMGLLPTPTASAIGESQSNHQLHISKDGVAKPIRESGMKGNSNLYATLQVRGLIPTPTAFDYNTPRKPETFKKAQERHKAKGVNLQNPLKQMAAMGMLPTPVAGEYRDTGEGVKTGNFKQMNLTRTIAKDNPEWIGKNSQLNPRFVAEMMGFPPNWTELPFQNGETNP
jgi:hypothetical protein